MTLTVYNAVKVLKLGVVVQAPDGSLCTVEDFDISQEVPKMPLTLKRIFDAACVRCKLSELQGIMVPVIYEGPGKPGSEDVPAKKPLRRVTGGS